VVKALSVTRVLTTPYLTSVKAAYPKSGVTTVLPKIGRIGLLYKSLAASGVNVNGVIIISYTTLKEPANS
jgi:hypothetical protein